MLHALKLDSDESDKHHFLPCLKTNTAMIGKYINGYNHIEPTIISD